MDPPDCRYVSIDESPVADLKERTWFVIRQGLSNRSRGDTKAAREDWADSGNSLWLGHV
jgi:hypothetical protein